MESMEKIGKSWWRAWWWVGCVCLAAASVFIHFIQGKKAQVAELSCRFEKLQSQKLLALQERESLQLQIASQSDPSWIEMILIRDLGVVPEGWVKVHFTKGSSDKTTHLAK
jgi:hypothetical protein